MGDWTGRVISQRGKRALDVDDVAEALKKGGLDGETAYLIGRGKERETCLEKRLARKDTCLKGGLYWTLKCTKKKNKPKVSYTIVREKGGGTIVVRGLPKLTKKHTNRRGRMCVGGVGGWGGGGGSTGNNSYTCGVTLCCIWEGKSPVHLA